MVSSNKSAAYCYLEQKYEKTAVYFENSENFDQRGAKGPKAGNIR